MPTGEHGRYSKIATMVLHGAPRAAAATESAGRPLWQECGHVLTELARALSAARKIPYSDAFREVAAQHPAVHRAYSEKQED